MSKTLIEIKKLTDRELIFIYRDKDKHTIPNLISKLALKKPYVKYSAYVIDHPLVSDPEIIIITDGSKKPVEVLEEILNEARSALKDLLKHVEELK
ncbi:MAG: DNA-directed RNA polymerase subunit L [Thermoprotei archaeon]|nr:MAG: DNA-directed RNA polymerase subunit L [Thermoprotei archaeon]